MSKRPKAELDDLRPEYDFTGGIRDKFAKRFAEGTNIVILEPDAAEKFPNSEAVNTAPRRLIGETATADKVEK